MNISPMQLFPPEPSLKTTFTEHIYDECFHLDSHLLSLFFSTFFHRIKTYGLETTWRKVKDFLISSKWKSEQVKQKQQKSCIHWCSGVNRIVGKVISELQCSTVHYTASKNRGFQMPPSYLWGGRTNPCIVPGLKWETSSFNALL